MILATHLVLSAYGFWLPNDPRGSWSDFVWDWELRKFGPATKVSDRRSHAHDPHNGALRRAAKQALKYPPVRFDAAQRHAIAEGYSRACAEARYVCFACCVGHDHAHLVFQQHDRDPKQIAGHLKSAATRELTRGGIHPLKAHVDRHGKTPSPWSAGCWRVFIGTGAQLHAATAYVTRHPAKEGLPPQNWSFVTRQHSPRVRV